MSSYIGAVQIGDSNDQYLVGSTLYGTCETAAATAAKKVVLSNFDNLITGITVHIKFISGNTATSGVNLQFYPSNSASATPTLAISAIAVSGNCVCKANDVVAFTLDDVNGTKTWRVNGSVDVAESSSNGKITVNGQDIGVHGLGTAAYTPTTDYATSAQGTKADNAMPKSGGTFTGTVTLSGAPATDLEAATKKYVDDATSNLAGLVGAMHFKGEVLTEPVADASAYETYESGDVVLYQDKEYVYNKGNSYSSSEWILLGAEGSYALNSNTANIGSASNWDAGSAPTLGTPIETNKVTAWDAGTASSATVTNGVLRLTNSTIPSLTYSDPQSIPNVTSAGSAPSLTISSTPVVVPVVSNP